MKKICFFIICFIMFIPFVKAETMNNEKVSDGVINDGKSAI